MCSKLRVRKTAPTKKYFGTWCRHVIAAEITKLCFLCIHVARNAWLTPEELHWRCPVDFCNTTPAAMTFGVTPRPVS